MSDLPETGSEQPSSPAPGAPSGPPAGTRPARYPRTANGLIGSMIVTVVLVLAFVGFRAVFSKDLDVKPERVDYLSVVDAAQHGGFDLVYPAALPPGWTPTSVHYTPGSRPAWGVGILTDDGHFVGLRQEDSSLDDLLHTYVDADPAAGGSVDVSGSVAPTWRTFSDSGGDHAYAAEVAGDQVLVYGSASEADLRALLQELTTAKRQ